MDPSRKSHIQSSQSPFFQKARSPRSQDRDTPPDNLFSGSFVGQEERFFNKENLLNHGLFECLAQDDRDRDDFYKQVATTIIVVKGSKEKAKNYLIGYLEFLDYLIAEDDNLIEEEKSTEDKRKEKEEKERTIHELKMSPRRLIAKINEILDKIDGITTKEILAETVEDIPLDESPSPVVNHFVNRLLTNTVFVKMGEELYDQEDAKKLANNKDTESHCEGSQIYVKESKLVHTVYISKGDAIEHILLFLTTCKDEISQLEEGEYRMYFRGEGKSFQCKENRVSIQTNLMEITIKIDRPSHYLKDTERKNHRSMSITHHFPISKEKWHKYLKGYPENLFHEPKLI